MVLSTGVLFIRALLFGVDRLLPCVGVLFFIRVLTYQEPNYLWSTYHRAPKDHINTRILQNNVFWFPPYIGPWSQNVRFLCLYYTIPHYTIALYNLPYYTIPYYNILYYHIPYPVVWPLGPLYQGALLLELSSRFGGPDFRDLSLFFSLCLYSRLQKVGIWICDALCWLSFCPGFWVWRIVIFQLSGFSCMYMCWPFGGFRKIRGPNLGVLIRRIIVNLGRFGGPYFVETLIQQSPSIVAEMILDPY